MYRADRAPKGFRGIGLDTDKRLNGIYIGLVKRNDDPQRMGRLFVWIPEFGGDPNDQNRWFNVSYASPFAGCTSPDDLRKDGQDMDSSSTSYGFWAVPPDLENQVLVCFAGGDPAHGFWIGCLYQQNMNHMVPGIPSNISTDPTLAPPGGIDGSLPPVVEYNRWSNVNTKDPPRPVYTPLHEGLLAQGLYRDQQRGPSTSGARRESPSRVVGILSPGGNSFVMDDGSDTIENSFIRLRTKSGVQVLLNDTNGFIYLISGNGNSWVEISDDGVDVFTQQSFSVRAEQDINMHADQNINMMAGQSINMMAGQSIAQESGTNIEVKAGGAINASASQNISQKSGGSILTSAKNNITSDAGGNITALSSGQNVRTASSILDNNGASAPSSGAPDATAPTANTVSDVGVTGGSTQTIVSRLPTHEPWPLHPRTNVQPLGHVAAQTGQDISNMTTPGGGTDSAPAQKQITTGSGRTVIMDQNYDDTSQKVNINGYKVSQTVLAAIKEASTTVGVDFGFLMAMAAQESGFNPNARPGINPATGARYSSAVGLYQFLDATWTQMVQVYGAQYKVGLNDRTIPRASALIGAQYAKDNSTYLQKHGITVGRTEMYIAHFLGQGGANTFLTAYARDPSQIAANISPAAARANPTVFYRNGAPKTCQDVYTFYRNKIEPMAVAFANQYANA